VFQNFLTQFFPTGSLTTSTGTFLASFGLCYTLTASIDILRDLFKPLKHLKASIDTLSASKDTLTASKDTLTASKALSGLCSLHALSWLVRENSQELSHGCESVAEAVRALYTLAASLGYPTRALSRPLLAPFWPLLTLSWPLLHSHGPTLILMGPCKHSHSSATVSRPPVALSLSLQALL
jgi:hypothetical protein